MKHLVLAVAVLVCVVAQTAFGQDELHKGVYVLGGSASYNSSTSTYSSGVEVDTHTLTLAPQFSIFVTDHLMIGLGLSYINVSETQTSPEYPFIEGRFVDDANYSASSSEFVFGPTVRYYLPMSGWYPFLGATFQASSSGAGGASSREIQFLAGTDLFIAHGVAIEPAISYLNGSQGGLDFHSFQIGAGVSYFITPR